MQSLMWKFRIATLWVFYAVGMVLLFILSLMEPGFIDELRAGRVEGMPVDGFLTIMMSGFVLIPLALAVLTFFLSDSVGRWVNAVGGAFFGAMMVWDVFEHLGGLVAAPFVAALVAFSGLLVLLLAVAGPALERAHARRAGRALAA